MVNTNIGEQLYEPRTNHSSRSNKDSNFTVSISSSKRNNPCSANPLLWYWPLSIFKERQKNWGTSVLETISSQLRKELPGLRGFSASNLKNMRLFYENWSFLEDQKSSDITGELLVSNANSSDASDELTAIIPISDFKISGINLADFPVEDFFKVPFSHHITIFSKVKNLQERYYYIHRVVEENLQVDTPVTSEEIKAVAERINRKLAEINGLDDEDSKDVKKKLKKAKRQIEKDYLPRKEKYEKADATWMGDF